MNLLCSRGERQTACKGRGTSYHGPQAAVAQVLHDPSVRTFSPTWNMSSHSLARFGGEQCLTWSERCLINFSTNCILEESSAMDVIFQYFWRPRVTFTLSLKATVICSSEKLEFEILVYDCLIWNVNVKLLIHINDTVKFRMQLLKISLHVL